jgi:hypothetical protein
LYIGRRKSSILIIPAGRRSKFLRTTSTKTSSDTLPVPNVSIEIETGCATPIAYAN